MAVALLGAIWFLVACGKIDTWTGDAGTDPVPVSFSTYAQRSETKADASYIAPGADFVSGAKIGVFGFYHDDSNWSTDADNIPDFMYNQLVTKQDDGSWTYSPVKYWPNETGASATSTNIDRLSFWGYYPHIEASAYSTASTPMYSGTDAELRFWKADGNYSTAYSNAIAGLPSVTFTQSSDVTKQVDLMFTALEPTKDLTKPTVSGKVQLTFRHALSLVQFNITAGGASLPDGAVVTIKTLTLTNVATKGNCSDPSASYTTDALAKAFWTSSTPSNVSLPAGNSDTQLILMPQELVQDGSTGHSAIKLSITYDISFPASDDPHDTITYKDNGAEAWLWSDAGSGAPYGVKWWLPGRKYTYNISAGLDVIEFSEVFTDTWATPVECQL